MQIHKHTDIHKAHILVHKDFTAPLTWFLLPPASIMMNMRLGFSLELDELMYFPFSIPLLNIFTVGACRQDLHIQVE